MESYISPKTKKGLKSSISGKGFFAIEPIPAGEVVAIKKGSLLSGEQLKQTGISGHAELQIGDDLYIAPATPEELLESMIYINHSCNPNVGMHGEATFVAMRDIVSGEELAIDYAMIDNDEVDMECTCRSVNCRTIIHGNDWMKPELQEKYKGYFSTYIQNKINDQINL